MDYRRPVKKSPSLHGRKSNPNPKSIGTAEAYFVYHIGPKFQVSLIYAFIGYPQSVISRIFYDLFFVFFRNAFISTVRRLSLLRDSNIAHVVAACTQDEPLCVLSEFTEYGDLCQFLRSHQQPPQQHYSNANDLNTSLSSSGGGSSGGSPTGLK